MIVADATGLPVIDGSQLTGITATDSTKLAIANNLSDLNNVGTARTNLGLGTASTSASSDFLAVSNNLSDLNNVGTARTNLGLGTASTKDTGVANGNVIIADATGLPVIDGSQLTGITATDSTKLAISNNLSDLNNVGTARTNLGLVIGTDVAAIASPAFTGSPTAPTQSAGDDSTKIATTEYVESAVSAVGGMTYSAITADPAPAVVNYHYSCTGSFTITLPTSQSAGSKIVVKNMGTGDITLDPQSSNIDGVTTDYVLDVQYSSLTLISDGTGWEII